MSRQAIDSAMRILNSLPDLIENEDYAQALENAEKARKLAEKANMPDLINWALIAKGEILAASCRLEEALETYEKALDLSTDLFLEVTEKIHRQEFLYDTIAKLVKTINELDSVIKAQQVCKKYEIHFEKVLAAYEKLLAENPENSEYLSNYLKTIENIWACNMIAGNLEKQIVLIPDIVRNYGKIIDSDPENAENFIRLDSIVKNFGEACLEEELFEEAKQVYEQLHTIYKNIHEKYPENQFALNLLLFSYDFFAKLYAEIDELDKVKDYYSQALELAEEQLKIYPEELSLVINQGKIYKDLGDLYARVDELEKANFYYEKSFGIFEVLVEKNPDDTEYQYKLASIFNGLAEAFWDISRVERAKDCYLHEIEIYGSLKESEIDEIDNEFSIAETFDQIAKLYAEDENEESAKEYYEKEMEIYERLFSEYPEETDYELYIAETFNDLGDLYFEKEELSARHYYEKALAISEKAVEQAPSDSFSLSTLIQTLKNLAELNKVHHHYETAITFQQRVLDLQLEMQEKFPRKWNETRNLGNAFSELGLLFEKVGDLKQAEQFHLKAVETFSELIFGKEEDATKKRLATEIQLRGYVYMRSKRYLSAKPYLELARKYYESACEQEPDNFRYESLFSILYEIGLLNYGMEKYEEAIESYEAAFLVLDRLIELSPEKTKQQGKDVKLYTGLGIAYSALNELEKSKEAFEKALASNAEYLAKEPENIFHLEDKAITLEEYANLLLKIGRNAEAEAYKAESAELYSKLEAEEPNLMKLRKMTGI